MSEMHSFMVFFKRPFTWLSHLDLSILASLALFASYIKSLYGSKQTLCAWFERFSIYLIGLGFSCFHADSSLFIKYLTCTVTIILCYVDDLIVTGNDNNYIYCLLYPLGLVLKWKILGNYITFLVLRLASDWYFLIPNEICKGSSFSNLYDWLQIIWFSLHL